MTYAQLGDLRVATIYRLNFNDKGERFIPADMLSYGLHLDARCPDGEHWYAIATIMYDAKNDSYDLRSVGSRLMNALTPDNLGHAQYLIDFAYQFLRKEWEELHPNED